MDSSLSQYIDRVGPAFSGIPRGAAHQVAFAFLSYKLGIYHDAVTRCDHALKLIEGRPVPGALGGFEDGRAELRFVGRHGSPFA